MFLLFYNLHLVLVVLSRACIVNDGRAQRADDAFIEHQGAIDPRLLTTLRAHLRVETNGPAVDRLEAEQEARYEDGCQAVEDSGDR